MELKLLLLTAQSSFSSLPNPTIILRNYSVFPKHFSLLPQCQSKEDKLVKPALSLGLPNRKWIQAFTVQPNYRLSLDKANISVLVLVPLIAFCIGCVVRALHRVTRNLRHPAENISRNHHGTSNSMRWRAVLGESTDPDSLNADSESNSGYISEGQEQMQLEDMSHDTRKLEDDYQKFLSECGMSERGYFRGGSSE